jgi:hypothetical protein
MSEQNLLANAQALYKCLRANTEKSQVTGRKWLLNHPVGNLSREDMQALLDTIGSLDAPTELNTISVVKGRKDTWYYDESIMTVQYAKIASLIEEKDILHTIAVVTRNDSALYPRPSEFQNFKNPPFYFTEDELLGAQARFTLDEQYADIGVVQASNGGKAFYSSRFLSPVYAQALIEKIMVDDPANP